MTRVLSRLAVACAAMLIVGAGSGHGHTPPSVPDVLKDAIAYYGTLTTYADTGTITQEVPGIVDTAKFATYFRRPTGDLYFDHQALASTTPATGHRIDMTIYRTVIWMLNGKMARYSFYERTHEAVEDGNGQVRALHGAGYATHGTSILIPSLLYPQARLPSTILQLEEATVTGVEDVNRHRCHKLVGVAAAYTPSGQRTSVRPVTVWIDAESRLVRRVFEDTPEGYLVGSYSRLTVTIEPHANPAIEDARFQFTVPSR